MKPQPEDEDCDHHDHMPGPDYEGKRTQLCWMCDAWCVEGDHAWRTTSRPPDDRIWHSPEPWSSPEPLPDNID